MFIDIVDSRDNITITVNKNYIVCIGPDTAHGRYSTLIEMANGKLIYSMDSCEDIQSLVQKTNSKK